jgi:hypothetical protein
MNSVSNSPAVLADIATFALAYAGEDVDWVSFYFDDLEFENAGSRGGVPRKFYVNLCKEHIALAATHDPVAVDNARALGLWMCEHHNPTARNQGLRVLEQLHGQQDVGSTFLLGQFVLQEDAGASARSVRGIELLHLAIEQGAGDPRLVAHARVALAEANINGWGVIRNTDEAVCLYKAARPYAKNVFLYLGVYYEGRDPEFCAPVRDFLKAAEYYTAGSFAGSSACMTNLALMHVGSRVPVSDMTGAIRLLRAASECGDVMADDVLDGLGYPVRGDEQSFVHPCDPDARH